MDFETPCISTLRRVVHTVNFNTGHTRARWVVRLKTAVAARSTRSIPRVMGGGGELQPARVSTTRRRPPVR